MYLNMCLSGGLNVCSMCSTFNVWGGAGNNYNEEVTTITARDSDTVFRVTSQEYEYVADVRGYFRPLLVSQRGASNGAMPSWSLESRGAAPPQ